MGKNPEPIVYEGGWTHERSEASEDYLAVQCRTPYLDPFWLGLLILVLLFVGFSSYIAVNQNYYFNYDDHFGVGIVVGLVLGACAILLWGWISQYRLSELYKQDVEYRIALGTYKFRIDESGFRTEFQNSLFHFDWSVIKGVKEHDMGVFLQLGPLQPAMISDLLLPSDIDRTELLRRIEVWRSVAK
jgi:hypothetical protein